MRLPYLGEVRQSWSCPHEKEISIAGALHFHGVVQLTQTTISDRAIYCVLRKAMIYEKMKLETYVQKRPNKTKWRFFVPAVKGCTIRLDVVTTESLTNH